MGRRLAALIAGAMVFSAASANVAVAADLLPPPKIEIGKKWYLRGHIGMSNQHLDQLEHPAFSNPAFFEWLDRGNFSSAPTFGVGIGIKKGDHLRFDIFAEYRGKADFSALDRYDTSDNPPDFAGGSATDWGINDYSAKKSEYLLMANAYYDIGTWHGITPYVGAGLGVSYNVISNFRDNNIIQGGGGYADTAGMLNLAWGLHAGVSVPVSERMKIDLGYSYLSLGDAKTGILTNYATGCSACAPVVFKNLTSHDFKMSLRYEFGHAASYDHVSYDAYEPPTVVKY